MAARRLQTRGFFTGNIALIDRGTCGFAVKALNAQNAGAVAVVIVNNVAGSPAPGLGGADPSVTIPIVSVTQSDGNLIKAQLGTGVNGTVKLDTTVRAGADPFGKALMFTPNPFQGGSSVSHWDTIAFPNQLMEPAINGDLTHNVTPPSDLTFSEMRDIGWVATALPVHNKDKRGRTRTPPSQPFVATLYRKTGPPGRGGAGALRATTPPGGGRKDPPPPPPPGPPTPPGPPGAAPPPPPPPPAGAPPYTQRTGGGGGGAHSPLKKEAPSPGRRRQSAARSQLRTARRWRV